jgi:hypothetical protein
MLIHEFDQLMEAKPFQPFQLVTADGRSVPVKSPEFAWHAPAGRTVFVASGKGDDVVRIVDLQLVTQFIVGFRPTAMAEARKVVSRKLVK